MKLISYGDIYEFECVAEFRFCQYEMARARFDAADHQVLEECQSSISIADKLRALELIARRIEEHRAREEREKEARGKAILTGKP